MPQLLRAAFHAVKIAEKFTSSHMVARFRLPASHGQKRMAYEMTHSLNLHPDRLFPVGADTCMIARPRFGRVAARPNSVLNSPAWLDTMLLAIALIGAIAVR
jgi:hypothetical protein